MDIESETLAVLRQMTWTEQGSAVLGALPPGQLDRKLYVAVNKVLEAAGGKWNRKQAAHVFAKDPRQVLGVAVALGTIRTARDDGYFPTPTTIAQRLAEKLSLGWRPPGSRPFRVLEPSAGEGALVHAVLELYGLYGVEIIAVERDRARAEELVASTQLRRAAVPVISCVDFLTEVELGNPVDGVIMNPPFDRSGTHLKHFWKAWSMLRPGGRMAAILPPSIAFREDEAHKHFRKQILEHPETTIEHLPSGAFADAGTQIATIMVATTKSTQVPPAAPKAKKAKKAKAEVT